MSWVAMSERDVQRVRVLSEVLSGRRTVGSAAAVLEVTRRQARRLLDRLRDGGGGRVYSHATGDYCKKPQRGTAGSAVAQSHPSVLRQMLAQYHFGAFGGRFSTENTISRHVVRGVAIVRTTCTSPASLPMGIVWRIRQAASPP